MAKQIKTVLNLKSSVGLDKSVAQDMGRADDPDYIIPRADEDVNQIIMGVAKKIAPGFVFPNYDVEDIVQEAYIMGLEAMERWDKQRPLENFLSSHIRNRLINLKRDKYFRPKSEIQEQKKKLIDASPVEDLKNLLRASAESENIEFRELLTYIDNHLPVQLRKDYIKLVNDDCLPRQNRDDLCSVLKEIVGKYYENGTA